MTLSRWIAVLLIMTLISCCGFAEEIDAASEGTDLSELAPEDIRTFVEAMFAAACGTTEEAEQILRQNMTEDEIVLLNAENAGYRARTLAWLIAALSFKNGNTDMLPMQMPLTLEVLESDTEHVYTVEDGFIAFSQRESGREFLSVLEEYGGSDAESSLSIAREICRLWMKEVDHAKLEHMNSDYCCWIFAPDTQIDYPVVQYVDNSRYLKRMFNGNYNSAGTLFIDYRNLADFQDPNTLIYGHHMRNDSMFGSLTDYANQEYYESHPFMLIMAEDRVLLLEICAGYTTTDTDHCYDIAISDEKDMQSFVQEAMEKSDFISGVSVLAADQLVTLSTCAYAFRNARYVVIARILPI